jgi:uncharacterized protein YgbK (DUF1537 family)
LNSINRWGLLADDLTGGCDSAAEFASAGFSVYFSLQPEARDLPDCEVLAVSSASRELEVQAARARVESCCRFLQHADYRLLMKKVDSALRGHWVAEIETTAREFRRREVFISPTIPCFHRSLCDGRVVLPPDSGLAEVDARAVLQSALGAHAASLSLTSLLKERWRATVPEPRFLLVDTVSMADLSALAGYVLERAPEGLLAGSAGLASALAARLAERPQRSCATPVCEGGPVVYWIGSLNPVCRRQLERLLEMNLAAVQMSGNRGIMVPVRFRPDEERQIASMSATLASLAPSAFVMVGGETAELVLRAIGARGIRLIGLIQPGIPWGTLDGGMFAGLPVVTKSGSFGGPDTLVDVHRFLRKGGA